MCLGIAKREILEGRCFQVRALVGENLEGEKSYESKSLRLWGQTQGMQTIGGQLFGWDQTVEAPIPSFLTEGWIKVQEWKEEEKSSFDHPRGKKL